MSPRPTPPRLLVLAGAAAAALVLAACGSSGSGSGSASPTATGAASGSPTSTAAPVSKDEALAKMVPAAIVAAGTVRVGSDTTYPPSEYLDTDNATPIGFDVELGKAIGEVLGVPFEFQTAPFDSIISGLGSKYDIGMSSFTINPERLAKANMVSYFIAGTSWAVQTGNPAGISPDDTMSYCGKRVAVQKATVQVDDITARDKACQAAGKEAITIDQYAAQTDASSAVAAGKDDAMLADSPVVAFAVKQSNGKLETTGSIYEAAPYGIAVPKDATEFAKAIQGAVQKLIDGGQYKAILTKWGVEAGAIDKAELNPSVG